MIDTPALTSIPEVITQIDTLDLGDGEMRRFKTVDGLYLKWTQGSPTAQLIIGRAKPKQRSGVFNLNDQPAEPIPHEIAATERALEKLNNVIAVERGQQQREGRWTWLTFTVTFGEQGKLL